MGKRVVAVCVVQGGSDATFGFSLPSPHVRHCTTLRSIQKHYSMALLEITTKAHSHCESGAWGRDVSEELMLRELRLQF